MHTFRVVCEQNGWAIQLGAAMSAPCKSRAMAIQQAERMAAAIRRHGEQVVIIVEPAAPRDAPLREATAAARMSARRLILRAQ